MKKFTIILALLAILISCSGCLSFSTKQEFEIANPSRFPEPSEDDRDPDDEIHSSEPTDPGETEKKDDPTEPTEPPAGYKYDFGTRIEIPMDADFALFYEMVQNLSLGWTSFDSKSASIPFLMDLVMDDVGYGMFQQYEFSFYEETVELGDEMMMYGRYYAEDIDWVLMAVFGREADHSQMVDDYGDTYFEEDWFYRFASEYYMGSPYIEVVEFDPEVELLPNGNWSFRIYMSTQEEFDDGDPVGFHLEIEAIPMHSADVGTYWRIVSFVNKG